MFSINGYITIYVIVPYFLFVHGINNWLCQYRKIVSLPRKFSLVPVYIFSISYPIRSADILFPGLVMAIRVQTM